MLDELENKRVYTVSVNGTRFCGAYTGRRSGSCVELVNVICHKTRSHYDQLIINI